MAFEYEEKALELPHKVTLEGRNRLNLTGVKEVESFDEGMVVLHTTRGTLVVRGDGLHLNEEGNTMVARQVVGAIEQYL